LSGSRGNRQRKEERCLIEEEFDMKSKTILIAYQDDLWARSLSTFLHGVGYRVETSNLVSEMIRKVRKGNIHVVLLDDEIEGVKACDLVPLLKKNDKLQSLSSHQKPRSGWSSVFGDRIFIRP